MSSLSIFPTEILEWITSVITTSQQMRLWQCGDRILNIKLKNGGLKRTSLCWSGWTWMPWPSWYFNTFDSLVDVKWDVSYGTSLCPTLELKLLPTTLNRLHLACEDVFILLRQQNVNMHAMIPLLESLHLSGSHLREENLKHLPSNLIELHVTSLGANIKSSNIFGDLPRHIERLTLLFDIEDQSELENDLPSNLTYLDLFCMRCSFNWVSKLPVSLKILKVDIFDFAPNWHTLPPHLEELILKHVGYYIPKTQLPQSLKTLKVYRIHDLTTEDELGPHLPKNLTRFSHFNPLAHPGLQKLPASLTDFDVEVHATHPDILSFYPRESIKIRLRRGPFSDKLNLFPFPTKLQSLQLDFINDDICAMLPLGLQKLKIEEGGLITITGASNLPKSLTSLIGPFKMFDDNEAMSHLGHLSSLELKFEKDLVIGKLNEHWISSILRPSYSPTSSALDCVCTGTDVNPKNPRLTSLRVREEGICPYIQKPFFDALTKFINLKILSVICVGGISSDWLGLIPQNVTHLDIDHITAYLTATQLSMLPKRLRYLSIEVSTQVTGECDWNDETFQSLPRTLQVFRISHRLPNLTQHVHEYLPPNLRLQYWQSSRVTYSSPLDRMYGK